MKGGNKRYFIIDQQIAPHFVHYSVCLLFYGTQIINPFPSSRISQPITIKVWGFQPIVKFVCSLMFLQCRISFEAIQRSGGILRFFCEISVKYTNQSRERKRGIDRLIADQISCFQSIYYINFVMVGFVDLLCSYLCVFICYYAVISVCSCAVFLYDYLF